MEAADHLSGFTGRLRADDLRSLPFEAARVAAVVVVPQQRATGLDPVDYPVVIAEDAAEALPPGPDPLRSVPIDGPLVAGELAQTREGSAMAKMLVDYAIMLEQAREF